MALDTSNPAGMPTHLKELRLIKPAPRFGPRGGFFFVSTGTLLANRLLRRTGCDLSLRSLAFGYRHFISHEFPQYFDHDRIARMYGAGAVPQA